MMYRGQPLTLRQVVRQGHCPPQAATSPNEQMRRSNRGGRQFKPLRVLSWNPGHLGAQQWPEIKDWLQSEAQAVCDVLLLQETHWSSSAQFTVAGWTCISSASPNQSKPEPKAKPKGRSKKPKSPAAEATGAEEAGAEEAAITRADGVIVLLSPRIGAGQIRWREHKVGRLLEARFVYEGCPFVVLCVYQHVWSSAKTPQQNRKDRGALVAALSKAVKQVPSRVSLVVAGDLNSSLSPSPRLVGPCTCATAHRHDSEGLQELVVSHKLVALNTWHASQPHTYTQQGTSSQIDFVLTKEIQAGGQSKWARPLHDWHLGSWTVGGHAPVLAVVKPIGHWMLPARREGPTCDVRHLQTAVREETEQALRMKEWVREHMPVDHPDQCNQVLLDAAHLFFPKVRRAGSREPDSRRMWQLAKEAKEAPAPDPIKQAQLEAAQERRKQLVKQRQKERAAKFLEGVDAAIAEGASHVAYSILKQLRPWQPPLRAQLKNKDGKLMGPEEELEALRTYASSTFGTHAARENAPASEDRSSVTGKAH